MRDHFSGTVGDGQQPESRRLCTLQYFLNNVPNGVGGIYLSGDDVAQDITTNPTPSQTTFRTLNMPYQSRIGRPCCRWHGRIAGHRALAGRYFSDDFFVFGGART
jgi:hypothetical protein